MKKICFFLIVALCFILPLKQVCSQDVTSTDVQRIIQANPEVKQYISPDGGTIAEGQELMKSYMGKEALTPSEIQDGLKKLKEEETEVVSPRKILVPGEKRSYEDIKSTKEIEISKPKASKIFPDGLAIFGHEIFSVDYDSFTPPSNMPVTADYIVGPDDNVIVQFWGRINSQYTLTVQRDGSMQLPNVGVIQVAGLTYNQLQNLIEHEAEAITGVNVNVTMGKLRSITVFVVGSVKKPGAYTVSAFDTILNALIYSGGPDSLGSMRNIQLKRRNKVVTTFDIYDLILKGDNSRDVRLEPGDIIFVPKAEVRIAISGDVKVPALYELKKDKTLVNALKLAGGITPSAYSEQIQIQRYIENKERIVLDTSMDELKRQKNPFTLQDEDVVKIFPVVKEDTNAVYLFGNVMRSGRYEYSSGMKVMDVIGTQGDLKPETFFPYALIKRYNPPEMSAELVPFNLGEALLKKNVKDNVSLRPGDEIHVFDKWMFEDKPYLSVSGEVRKPGLYLCDEGTRIKDAVFMAGGLTDNAYMGSINIFRTNPKTKEISMLITNLANAMKGQENSNMLLQDRDSITIHSIREYMPKEKVSIYGEVANPGEYPLSSDMTIRDLVFASGNIKESAYIYSAELTRYDTSNGKFFRTEVQKVNLKGALEGKELDNVKLKKFDTLFIPAIPKWQTKTKVGISGEVTLPGEYNFTDKGTLSELIERAGGYLPAAYLRGAVLTRESARERQKATLDRLIFEMEQDLAASSAAAESGALSQEDIAAAKAAMASRQTLLNKLKTSEVTGRVVIRLASLDKLKGSKYDIVLEDGDTLYIPKEQGVVHVMGSVYNPTSLLCEKGSTVEHYLSMVGGPTVNANPDDMFVIRADGTIVSSRGGGSNSLRWDEDQNRWFGGGFDSTILYPGDTILVPRKLIEISGLKMTKDVTSIIYQIAVSVGVLHTLF